jgi:hypothetical protein
MYFRLDFLLKKDIYTRRFLGCALGHGPGGMGPISAPVYIETVTMHEQLSGKSSCCTMSKTLKESVVFTHNNKMHR